MADLDQWTENHIVLPLLLVSTGSVEATRRGVQENIRKKVLEVYRRGQAAGLRKTR